MAAFCVKNSRTCTKVPAPWKIFKSLNKFELFNCMVFVLLSLTLCQSASAQALARGEDGRTYLVQGGGDGRFVPMQEGTTPVSVSSDGTRSLYVTAPNEVHIHVKETVTINKPNGSSETRTRSSYDNSPSTSVKITAGNESLKNSHNLPKFSGNASSQSANLPVDLYTQAVMEQVEADEDFNYNKVQKISSLPVYPKGYRAAKNLVDKVVVNKMEHAMYLYKGSNLVRKYWIALSDRPQGNKVQEGDRRTPEGAYTLDYVKNDSYYYRAFHISYPNPDDIARARARGVRPGGMIMVHGQPPSGKEYQETVQRSDWTNGCIALLNPEMDEFINLVDPGTLIVINP